MLHNEIYRELEQAFEKGNYSQILAKYHRNKSSFYSALSQLFLAKGKELEALVAREKETRANLSTEESRLEKLTAEVAQLQEKIAGLRQTLDQNSELLSQLAELKNLGFSISELKLLKDALAKVVRKHKLGSKEVLQALGEYDTILGLREKIETEERHLASLEKQKAEIEALIHSRELSLQRYDDVAAKIQQLTTVVANEVDRVCEKIDEIAMRAIEVGRTIGHMETKLQQWEGVRDMLAGHLKGEEK